MDFGGEFTVDRPVGEVAELLKKPEELARLIPGVTKVLKSGDSYVADVVVKVGSLSGKMATRFKYLETDGG
ncbi:MAG: SRPBCC domain-containing protein, partial [Pyrobaculum sp.]